MLVLCNVSQPLLICDQICQKGSYICTISRHTFHHHLLATYINAPTAHVFNTAESWTVCFHSGPFLKSVWHPQVLGWPLNGPIFFWQADSWLWITTLLADEFSHGFSYASKNLSKMEGKPASYPAYSRYNELLWIAIGCGETWQL